MCGDEAFSEDDSHLVLGPIHKQRWIYACSKQLLDRVIWAYGASEGLDFTLVRPFNWIGPRLDSPETAKEGSSRVVTQFIDNLIERQPIRLVDGGGQRRCFTYVDDGIDCLMRILENPGGCCAGQIFNIGNPANECSMRDLAHRLLRLFREHEDHREDAEYSEILEVGSDEYYGAGYQDILTRTPDITKAALLLGWRPRFGLEDALRLTLQGYLESAAASVGDRPGPRPHGSAAA